TEEVVLEERDTRGPAKRVDGAEMQTVRPDERSTHACVLARFAGHLPIVVRAPQPLASLLEMSREHVALIGVEQVVRRVAVHVERDGAGGSSCRAPWIQSERNQIVANAEVFEARVGNRAPLKLVDQRHGPVVLGIRLMPQRNASAKGVQ